jgi:hypothetical protein
LNACHLDWKKLEQPVQSKMDKDEIDLIIVCSVAGVLAVALSLGFIYAVKNKFCPRSTRGDYSSVKR